VGGCDNSATAASAACPREAIRCRRLAAAWRHYHFAYLFSFTKFNANKHYQFDQDVAFFKGGWWGTHNFRWATAQPSGPT